MKRVLAVVRFSPVLYASMSLCLAFSFPALPKAGAFANAKVAPLPPVGARYNGKIVFSSDRHGSGLSIWTMNPDGSNPTRLTDEKSRPDRLPSFIHIYDDTPAWSPDGTKIAFISNRDRGSFIYTMNADGTSLQLLTGSLFDSREPAWSPDGKKIAFVVGGFTYGIEKPVSDIYVINSDGTGLTKLISDPTQNLDFTWSPDGKQIAFASTRDPDGRSRIWVMNSDGSNQRRLTDIHDTTNPIFYYDATPSWSPDGTKILFNGARDFKGTRNCYVVNCAEIFVMNADGSNDHAITNDSNRGGIYRFPKWSPDGTKIVTSVTLGTIADLRNSIGRGRAIIVMNADGTNQTNISNRGKYDFNRGEYIFFDVNPDWQPLASPPSFTTSVVGFSASSYSTYEDARTIPITVNRAGGLHAVASCSYATLDGTATTHRDYSPCQSYLFSSPPAPSPCVPVFPNQQQHREWLPRPT